MTAFEKISSGIPSMDKALDHIRMGDNVVLRVSSLSEFREFARPFAEQAIRDGRNMIYVRFANHEPILEPMEGLKIVNIRLSHLFETFTIRIHKLIEEEGRDAFYVFDCLSELEEAWATDLLMGDFFHLTCPFLFVLDTVAFFPVLCPQGSPAGNSGSPQHLRTMPGTRRRSGNSNGDETSSASFASKP